MVGVVALFLLSVLRPTEVAQNIALFFLKMPKVNHIKIVIFRKYFSRCFRNIQVSYGI